MCDVKMIWRMVSRVERCSDHKIEVMEHIAHVVATALSLLLQPSKGALACFIKPETLPKLKPSAE